MAEQKRHLVSIAGIEALVRSIRDGGQEIPRSGIMTDESLRDLATLMWRDDAHDVSVLCLAAATWTEGDRWPNPSKKQLMYLLPGGSASPSPLFSFAVVISGGVHGRSLLMASERLGPAVVVYNSLPLTAENA